MTRIIPLNHGKSAIVDDEDYDSLMQYTWHYRPNGYACRQARKNENSPRKSIMMHRQILDTPEGMHTDHINGNSLDNRRCNLRACTNSQNLQNAKKHKNSSSKYKGVSWKKRYGHWQAALAINNKDIHLGTFYSEIDAAKAYNEAALRYFGEFAKLNVL